MTWNDVFESARSSWEWAISHDPPEGWAILIGLGLGVSVITWQINRGIRSLIKAQRNQGELAYQASLQTLQQQRGADTDARRENGKTLAAALIGELTACNRMHSLQKSDVGIMQTTFKKSGTGAAINTPVYQSSIPRLGFLGASLVADVVTVYSLLQMEQAELRDIAKVITRLKAFEENSPDPGPVFSVESTQEAENSAHVGAKKSILVTRHETETVV